MVRKEVLAHAQYEEEVEYFRLGRETLFNYIMLVLVMLMELAHAGNQAHGLNMRGKRSSLTVGMYVCLV